MVGMSIPMLTLLVTGTNCLILAFQAVLMTIQTRRSAGFVHAASDTREGAPLEVTVGTR